MVGYILQWMAKVFGESETPSRSSLDKSFWFYQVLMELFVSPPPLCIGRCVPFVLVRVQAREVFIEFSALKRKKEGKICSCPIVPH